MPLTSGPGAPRPKKPVGYTKPRRCLGIITPETLEVLRKKGIVTDDEYSWYKRLMDEMQ